MNPYSPSVIPHAIFQKIIELLHEGIAIEDLEGKISFVNQSFCQITGFKEEEWLNTVSLEQIVPANLENEGKMRRDLNALASFGEHELQLMRKDGTMFRGLVKITPLTSDDSEKISGRIISLVDVSENLRELHPVKESDEGLRFLMETSSEGVLIHDNGIITDVNQATLKMFDYTYEDLIGKSFLKITTPKEHAGILKIFREKLPFQGERELLDSHGKIHYVELNSKSLIHKGKEVQMVTLRDVTELHEKQVVEQRLISSIEASPFLVAMLDSKGLRYLNRSGRNMLGYGPDEDISKLGLADFTSKISANIIFKQAMPAAVHHGIWEGQTTFIRKDKSEFVASQIVIAHRNESGELDFFSSLASDITERQKAEQVLKESQERLRYFMEESLEAIFIQDQGAIIDFNTAACRMFGYEADELHFKKILSLYDVSFHREIKKQLARGQTIFAEWTGVKKDGTRFDIEVYSRPDIYQGKDIRIVSILDISSRKKAERALRSSQLMLNAAVEGTNVGIWKWNLVTDEVTFNEAWRKIRDLNEDEVPKSFEEWKETIHKDDLPALLENLKNHLYGLTPMFHQIYRAQQPSGKVIVMESKGKLVRDENNMPAYIVGTDVDITERQAMEDALRKSQAELSALIQHREEAIWSVDSEQKIINFNKRFADAFKYHFGIEPVKGAVITEGLQPDVAAKWVERFEICMKGESFQFVELFKFKDREIFVEFTANPIRISDNTIIGVSVLGRDITQQIQFEQSLKKAKEFAEEASHTKTQFLANISHEIRTPMNGIIGFTDLLLASKVNMRQKEYLELVRYSADSLLRLINDLLDVSKIEAGKMSLVNKEFDLQKLLHEIIRSFKPKANEHKLKIVASVDKSIPKILIGDELRLQQIFVNLIGNAIKFSEHGKISVRLKLKEKLNDRIVLAAEVEDEGIGIAEEKHEAIFEPFNQLGDPLTTKYGGTGLGLSIARRLVEMMEGEIDLESESGKGSKFYFTVQLQVPSPIFQSLIIV